MLLNEPKVLRVNNNKKPYQLLQKVQLSNFVFHVIPPSQILLSHLLSFTLNLFLKLLNSSSCFSVVLWGDVVDNCAICHFHFTCPLSIFYSLFIIECLFKCIFRCTICCYFKFLSCSNGKSAQSLFHTLTHTQTLITKHLPDFNLHGDVSYCMVIISYTFRWQTGTEEQK